MIEMFFPLWHAGFPSIQNGPVTIPNRINALKLASSWFWPWWKHFKQLQESDLRWKADSWLALKDVNEARLISENSCCLPSFVKCCCRFSLCLLQREIWRLTGQTLAVTSDINNIWTTVIKLCVCSCVGACVSVNMISCNNEWTLRHCEGQYKVAIYFI